MPVLCNFFGLTKKFSRLKNSNFLKNHTKKKYKRRRKAKAILLKDYQRNLKFRARKKIPVVLTIFEFLTLPQHIVLR